MKDYVIGRVQNAHGLALFDLRARPDGWLFGSGLSNWS